MANEIPLSPEELDYSKREQKIYEERENNPNISPGILVEKLAEKISDKYAVLFEDVKWTWEDLNQASNKVANYFLNNGYKTGETIALMMENSPEILSFPLGINKIQGIVSYININQRMDALIHAFRISEPSWIVIDGSNLPFFIDIYDKLNFETNNVLVINERTKLNHKFFDLGWEFYAVSNENPSTTFNSYLTDVSSYIFTSGTTGLPKPATQSNVRLLNPFASLTLKLSQEDVIYCPLPLYHSHALVNGWGSSLQSGCTFAFRIKFSASNFWKDIKKFNATCFFYIGEIPRYLLNRPKSEYVENSTLKKMFGLGLRKDIWEEFKSRFKIEQIHEFYGATDGAGGFYNMEGRPGMLGKISTPGTHAIVKVDQDTGEILTDEKGTYIKCKPGEIGMLLVAISENSHYLGYKDKDQTEKRIIRNVLQESDIFFNTGDLVNLHDGNWVSFADRSGDTFRWKGENVSTLEVENIINDFPDIEMCNVFGVEIPNHDGKAGMAAIKLKSSIDFNPTEFAVFVIDKLPKYSIPIFVRVQSELELTGTLKLRKVNLRKQGYNINLIKNAIYIWKSSTQSYKLLEKDDYSMIVAGKMNI
ncbi:MAG: AMP-binding protein [Candidatus Lokiarchaeota archaeon]|nr:AMP-binding protein [Candidatus Lokiarchaeota archaeon]